MAENDRKARLKALAAKAGRTKEAPAEEPEQQPKNIKFRNYAPTDPSLDSKSTGPDDDNDEPLSKRARTEEQENADSKPKAAPTAKSMLQEALAQTKQQSTTTATEVTTLAPKKINWDLKRDIQPKLDKLEKRTQKAIVEMLKERLELEAAKEMDDEDDDDDNLD